MALDIILKDSGTKFNIVLEGGVTIHYRQLFFSDPCVGGFVSITDGVKPLLRCPGCGNVWQGLKQAASDIKQLVTFQCPYCLKNIGVFVKTTTYHQQLQIQRSDAEGAGGIPP